MYWTEDCCCIGVKTGVHCWIELKVNWNGYWNWNWIVLHRRQSNLCLLGLGSGGFCTAVKKRVVVIVYCYLCWLLFVVGYWLLLLLVVICSSWLFISIVVVQLFWIVVFGLLCTSVVGCQVSKIGCCKMNLVVVHCRWLFIVCCLLLFVVCCPLLLLCQKSKLSSHVLVALSFGVGARVGLWFNNSGLNWIDCCLIGFELNWIELN